MKKKLFSATIVLGFLSSCAITTPFAVTNNDLGSKIGKSETICLFTSSQAPSGYQGIMLNKDFGIVEAAKKGGITKIGAVDLKVTNYMFFVKKEFIVAGE